MCRSIGVPSVCASSAMRPRYGIRDSFSRVNRRVISTASSSNAHGTRTDPDPCRRECDESSPNASHRLNTSGSGVPSNPPMSWLQYPKPDRPSDRPPRRVSAMEASEESLSPPQWTGNCWPPTVADRANSTASPSPRTSRSTSNTVRL